MAGRAAQSKGYIYIIITIPAPPSSGGYWMDLRPRGGRKLALQNGKVEGSEVGKNTALFLEAGVKESFICGSLPGSSCERRERRETERRETERRERERGERDERDEKEMREMREMRETVRQ